jgi:hypothetical protein
VPVTDSPLTRLSEAKESSRRSGWIVSIIVCLCLFGIAALFMGVRRAFTMLGGVLIITPLVFEVLPGIWKHVRGADEED